MRPLNLIGGGHNNQSFRKIKIASGYDTNIVTGDIVKLVAAGTIEKDAGTTACTPIGVFVGCEYTDPSLGYLLHNDLWPADTVASDAYAYVVDDPDMLFQIQADDAVTQAMLGSNFAVVQGTANTALGRSGVALDGDSTATTNTLPLRLVDFVDGPFSTVGDAYTDCIVKWNAGHAYGNATGV